MGPVQFALFNTDRHSSRGRHGRFYKRSRIRHRLCNTFMLDRRRCLPAPAKGNRNYIGPALRIRLSMETHASRLRTPPPQVTSCLLSEHSGILRPIATPGRARRLKAGDILNSPRLQVKVDLDSDAALDRHQRVNSSILCRFQALCRLLRVRLTPAQAKLQI